MQVEVCGGREEKRREKKQRKADGRFGIGLAVLGPAVVRKPRAVIYLIWWNCLCSGVAMQKKQCETS